MKHVKEVCTSEDCKKGAYCSYCDGGLFSCSVCGCAEGELTTDCYGKKVDALTRAHIIHGQLDYKDGKWIHLDQIDKDKEY